MTKVKQFFSFSFILALLLAVAYWFVYYPDKELEGYKVKTKLNHLNPEELQTILNKYIGDSFWRLDIEQIHKSIEKLEWVDQAQVTRKWPNFLVVEIVEQTPVAKWGNSGLLNAQADIFYPYDTSNFEQYVALNADDKNAKAMLEKLSFFQTQFNRLNWHIVSIDKRVDKGWLISFTSGTKIILGKQGWQDQIERFILSFSKVKKPIRKQAQTYDLRYSNGFVVKLKKKL